MIFLSLLLSLLQVVLAMALLYHYVLLIGSIRRPQFRPRRSGLHRFALLIPAHNEEGVIGQTVRSLGAVDYPRELFDIFVAADHCQDGTASVAREAGAQSYERNEGLRGRKGYPLAWLMERVLALQPQYDAVVVFDADSRVNHAFLHAMNGALNCDYEALQGQHIIANPNDSVYNSLAAIDMRLNNRVRNTARHNMGSSARLMGDAMCFSSGLLHKYPWDTYSLTEDIEYGVLLLLAGIRIGYVPDAISYGQAAGGWQSAGRQRLRWEGGVLSLRRRLAIRLLRESLRQRRLDLFDRGLELVLPPYSILAALTVLVLLAQLVLPMVPALVSLAVSLVMVLLWVAFPLLGLLLDRAPLTLYLRLLYGPMYIGWRVYVTAVAIIHRGRVQWVRTPHHEESH